MATGNSAQPHVLIFAGPNGAGKSTAAASLLPSILRITEYVNADVIARGLSAFNPEAAALQAGRIMLTRLKQLAAAHASFAFETTLASRHFAPWASQLVASGYAFDLYFFWIPSPEQAIDRVAKRVRSGGHHVPDATVRRRYHRGIGNFFQLYEPLTTSWRFYDNSAPSGPRLIASKAAHGLPEVIDRVVWDMLAKEYAQRGYNDE